MPLRTKSLAICGRGWKATKVRLPGGCLQSVEVGGGGIQVGARNRHNVANWRSNLETVHILAILNGFLSF